MKPVRAYAMLQRHAVWNQGVSLSQSSIHSQLVDSWRVDPFLTLLFAMLLQCVTIAVDSVPYPVSFSLTVSLTVLCTCEM